MTRKAWQCALPIAVFTPVLLLAPASALRTLTDASPSIEVSPASMSFDVPPDGTGSADLTITNNGDAPLHYTISTEPVAGTMNVPSTMTASATEVHTVDWTADHVPGRLIVGLKPGVAAASVSSLHKQLGATVKHSYKLIPAQVIEVKKGSDLRKVAEAYAKNPQVAYAEPDYLLEWYGRPNDPSIPAGMFTISADDAWDITTGSDDVIVAVLDSGTEVTHPDLAANIWTNPGEIAGNGLDDDHNGYIDDIHGWDFWENDPDMNDNFGHGTHCAGIVGAVGNNGIGVVGVNWKVKLLGIKWGDADTGPTSMMISALQYAVRAGARISSNSYGGDAYSQAAYDAIAAAGEAGHLFVAAAGNSSRNNDVSPTYPCSYNLDNIISVAALQWMYTSLLASFSNYGPQSVDLAAPGESVKSTFPPHTYKTWQGTSMACPHVAGAAALALARNPELSPLQVKSRILNGADQYDTLAGKLVTGGRLNAYRSLGVPWLEATLATGEIAPGESTVVRVSVNAKALNIGFSETCNLRIDSDAANQPAVSVPVTLSVHTYLWLQHNTPLGNTEDTVGPYNVDAYIGAADVLDESSMAVYWNTTGSGTFSQAPLARIDATSSLCRGQIPGQPAGTTVYYYIYAADTAGHAATHPVTAPTSLHRFEVLADTTPPLIEHTPLQDTSNRAGPYQVTAAVTDAMGVRAVALYWSRNGGAFTPVSMTKVVGQYTASIPGPANSGDRFCYYIFATDGSAANNAGVYPAGAPDNPICFTVGQCGADTIGELAGIQSSAASGRGNAFRCTSGAYLTEIEQFLTLPSPTELRFCVYESTSDTGPYGKIHETTVPNSATGQAWYSSGPISVELVAGRYYIIGAAWQGTAICYSKPGGHPVSTGFGASTAGYSLGEYPPASIDPMAIDYYACYQRLTTCQGTRNLTLNAPDGGEWFEPGETVQIRWQGGGSDWVAGDTVRLEYSTDSGAAWNGVAGAENLGYDAASFDWNTSGLPGSTHCRVRVVYNGDPTIYDESDADFAVQADTTPPTITHTPIPDSANVAGPYRVIASVTDNQGVGTVMLYWSRNGSAFTSVPMAPSGWANDYAGDIPGPSQAGDRYCYYIEATDTSIAANAARHPAGGPDAPNCFLVSACGAEEIGLRPLMTSATNSSRGNVFECTGDCVLTKIEQALGIDTSTELRFFVYEATSENGTYTKIHETFIPSTGTGLLSLGTGPISVEMVSGRYYIIGAAWKGNCMYYYGGSHPWQTAFGRSVGGFAKATYLPPGTTTNPNAAELINQKLSICQLDRTLRVVTPNGGQAFEPGNRVRVEWVSRGRYWQAGETVRLEYSSDGGATWSPIAGAGNVPQELLSYEWDTTGVAESTRYRVKVVYNGDPSVNDASDADFAIVTDGTPPVITHVPLVDSSMRSGPYRVCATVTDEHGLDAVSLHWRKNRGEFAVVPMTPSDALNEYCADIPGPGVVGAQYQYYIEARDVSMAHNTSRHPSGAPDILNSFTITPCSTDTVGAGTSNTAGTKYTRGNVYECTSSLTLTQMEQYLNITASAELRFAVYEATSLTGSYTKIHETVLPSSGTGLKWYSSGPVSVQLTAGRSYIIATACGGLATFYLAVAGHPASVNFGQSRSSYQSNIYPPRPTASNPNNPAIYYQRLTTCATATPLSQAKCLADDVTAILTDETVSAVFADRLYVQKADRSSGIGVLWSGAMPSVGDHVGVVGVTCTIGHERLIDAVFVEVKAIGARPEPIAMTNYRVGGNDRCFDPGPPSVGQRGFVGAIGLNNIGLRVTTWGRVTRIGDGYLYIDDGSRLRDGTFTGAEPNVGLRIVCDPTGYSVGDYLRVTGISSCFKNQLEDIGRRVLVSTPDDMSETD